MVSRQSNTVSEGRAGIVYSCTHCLPRGRRRAAESEPPPNGEPFLANGLPPRARSARSGRGVKRCTCRVTVVLLASAMFCLHETVGCQVQYQPTYCATSPRRLGITTSGSVLALLGWIVGDVHRLETCRTIIGDHRVSKEMLIVAFGEIKSLHGSAGFLTGFGSVQHGLGQFD